MLLEQLKDCNVYIQDVPEMLEEVAHTNVVVFPGDPNEEQIDQQITQILSDATISWGAIFAMRNRLLYTII
jgi:hypothetical protein